jgi:hypothetical protein
MNLSEKFQSKTDSYNARMGAFVVADSAISAGDSVSVWDHFIALGSRQVRVLYRCRDGVVRDIIGRQGVYASEQDGAVRGNGHAMRSRARLTISFHTSVHGGAGVNVGAGKGYRTLRAAGILAYRCEGTDFITNEGLASL